MNLSRTLAASLLPLLLIAPAAVAQEAQTPDAICAAAPTSEPEIRTYTESEQVTEPGVDYRAIFCTESGAVYIDLLEDEAPLTVNNFVFLVNSGYYNQTTFHRVIADFMAQGGDPTATGTGGPGYTFEDEISLTRTFDRPGLLAMANAGPNTNGSQFFITTVPTPHLNGMHTIFGEVLNGQGNVENIRLRDPQTAAEPGAALETIVIVTDPTSVTYEQSKPAREDAEAAFEELTTLIPPDLLAFDSDTSGVFTTEEAIDAAPEAGRDLLANLLETHNHQFRAANTLVNTACDLENVFFMSIGYTVDVFAANEDAAAAFADPALSEIATAQNFTDAGPSEALPGALYFTQETSVCDTAAVSARAYKQRGPLLITLETTIPQDALPVTADVVLGEFVALQIYEPLLTELLYADIR